MMSAFNISDEEFNMLQGIMYEKTGVFLRPTKKPLVVARLRRRLEDLGDNSFGAYVRRLKCDGGQELEMFINAITTNETNFYRHPKQMEFLCGQVLPALKKSKEARDDKTLRIWSAGCATGEEAFTVAMMCQDFLSQNPLWTARIFASDINSAVLASARQGLYSQRSLRELPEKYVKRYFIQTGGPGSPLSKEKQFQLSDKIIRSVEFSRHNLLSPFSEDRLDIVFMRNVMIYFDRGSKQRVINLVTGNLAEKGYLFISLAENLADKDEHLCFLGQGVYQKV